MLLKKAAIGFALMSLCVCVYIYTIPSLPYPPTNTPAGLLTYLAIQLSPSISVTTDISLYRQATMFTTHLNVFRDSSLRSLRVQGRTLMLHTSGR
ncbi:hypothetical protein B0T24DRAFT_21446 [Lasiosphaeria ovina]|uniref:Uncharacterized protein n=1 Tax=Lasiosphaeria ovina TaxID=92902 RepID=A0AAE0NJM3_9PEZI|nr:hypothetical protein B0T24DRAFT_21446 [Lasiosphaeria ovina]